MIKIIDGKTRNVDAIVIRLAPCGSNGHYAGNFLEGTLSVGVITDCEDKTTDNGRYEIGDNWEIFHIKDGKTIANAKPELDDICDEEMFIEEWNECFMKLINKNMPDKLSGTAIKGAICK